MEMKNKLDEDVCAPLDSPLENQDSAHALRSESILRKGDGKLEKTSL